MQKIQAILKNGLLSAMIVCLVGAFPAAALADDAPAPSSDPATSSAGPTKPTGADSSTYHLNTATGYWENDYYIWNPKTGKATPKTSQTYSYNPKTGMWDTTDWIYDAPSGKYIPNKVSVPTPPAGAPTTAPATIDTSPTAKAASDPSVLGPDSNNNVANNGSGGSTFDNFYNANISNSINANAQTGNASVSSNTTGGSALTGNAQSIANVINLLQSAASLSDAANLGTFVANIDGDVQGDLVIDPSALAGLQSTNSSDQPSGNVKVNNSTDATINNDINLNAGSGDASVSKNTTAGDATSGTANAVANVVNMINSMVAANQSFLGVININGNLNGNIVLPADVLSTLLASNTTDGSSPSSGDQSLNLTDSTNGTINNNVNTTASTGNATVDKNTDAGSATTGAAKTNVTILNLTGHQVIAKDSLLVFVNVLGKWVGVIMNAPTGSTAAALGGGVSQDNVVPSGNLDMTNNTNATINNNIDVNSASGDASVTKNTKAGNATTGDATSSVNLANLLNTQLSLSNWFGVLFINVFGTWTGDLSDHGSVQPGKGSGDTGSTAAPDTATPKAFKFTPTSSIGGAKFAKASTSPTAITTSSTQDNMKSNNKVLAATTIPHLFAQPEESHSSAGLFIGGFALLLTLGIGTQQAVTVLRRR